MKMVAKLLNILLALLILAGLAGTGLRFLEKRAYDESNLSVNVIMDYDEAVLLPGSGDPSENLEILARAGFSALMMGSADGSYDKLTLEALRYYKLKASFLTETPFVAESFVSSYLTMGADYPLLLADSYADAGSLSGADAAGLVIGRYLGREAEVPADYGRYISVLAVTDTLAFADDAFITAPLVQRMADAVVNEGVRVLYIAPLTSENGEQIIGVTLYARLMDELSAALKPYGFRLDNQLGTEPLPGTDFAVLLIALGVCAALTLLLSGFKRLRALAALIVLGALLVLTVLLWLLAPETLAAVSRYAALLLSPPLAVYYFARRCRTLQLSNGNRSLGSVLWYALGCALLTALIAAVGSLAGALCVIDPALTVPGWFTPALWAVTLAATLVLCFRLVYRQADATVGEYFYSAYDAVVKNKARSVAVLLVLATGLLLYLFVLRPAPYSLGDRINGLVERWLVVHPNIGLYLVGLPSLVAALALCGRRLKSVAWLFMLLGCIAPASFARYFVSPALPLQHILTFTAAGLAFGLLLALLVGILLSALFKSLKFRGHKDWYLY